VYLCGEALCFGLFVIGRLVLNSYQKLNVVVGPAPPEMFLVPKLQLGNAMAGKAPALNRCSGASRIIYVPKLELGNEMTSVPSACRF